MIKEIAIYCFETPLKMKDIWSFHVLPHMKASKTFKMKLFVVYRYTVLKHPPKWRIFETSSPDESFPNNQNEECCGLQFRFMIFVSEPSLQNLCFRTFIPYLPFHNFHFITYMLFCFRTCWLRTLISQLFVSEPELGEPQNWGWGNQEVEAPICKGGPGNSKTRLGELAGICYRRIKVIE